jgi:hypothetical protein
MLDCKCFSSPSRHLLTLDAGGCSRNTLAFQRVGLYYPSLGGCRLYTMSGRRPPSALSSQRPLSTMLALVLFFLSSLSARVSAVVHVPLISRHNGQRDVEYFARIPAALSRKYGGTVSSRDEWAHGKRAEVDVSMFNIVLSPFSYCPCHRLSVKFFQFTDMSYYAEVMIGTPAKAFSILLDTGSSDLWVASTDCVQCYDDGICEKCDVPANFDPSDSDTFKTCPGCNASITYGLGGVSGRQSTETVQFAGFTLTEQAMCAWALCFFSVTEWCCAQ